MLVTKDCAADARTRTRSLLSNTVSDLKRMTLSFQSAETVPAILASRRQGSHHNVPTANTLGTLGAAPHPILPSCPGKKGL